MKLARLSSTALSVAALFAAGIGLARADDIKLRIASGHPAVNTYVNLMQNFFCSRGEQTRCRAHQAQA